MLHKDPETKALQAQQTIDHINPQIQKYQQQNFFSDPTSPNTQQVNKTKEDIIKNLRLYCSQLKQDLNRIKSKEMGEEEDSNEDSMTAKKLSVLSIHPLHSDSSLGFTAIPPTPAYLLKRALGFRWHACTASKSLQPLKPLVPSLSVKYFAKSTEILKSLSQIHRSLFPTTLMVSRPHTTRCLPSSPTSPEKMRSPVNNIHSVSLHAPQILLFRFVCSVYFLVFLAFRFVCYDDTGNCRYRNFEIPLSNSPFSLPYNPNGFETTYNPLPPFFAYISGKNAFSSEQHPLSLSIRSSNSAIQLSDLFVMMTREFFRSRKNPRR
ncbi:hypothetical protein LXL04_020372 [Taraxacum kok-saghyz]